MECKVRILGKRDIVGNMGKRILRPGFWSVLILLVFSINIATPAATKKIKNCGFTVDRVKVIKKAKKVKKGSAKLNVKSGFVRFVAPSRAKYHFKWTGPSSGRANIVPLFALNNNTLSCFGTETIHISGHSRNICCYHGDMSYTKYKQIKDDGDYMANTYSLVLDKGEELYFYIKTSTNKQAGIRLTITSKAAPNVQLPGEDKVSYNFEKLKQLISERNPHNTGDITLKRSWNFGSSASSQGKEETHRLIYKKQADQIVFEWEIKWGESQGYKMYMVYDRSVISRGTTDIHVTYYSEGSVGYDAISTVNIYTVADETDMHFNVKHNAINKTVNYINGDAFFRFDSCFDPGLYFAFAGVEYKDILSDFGMSFKDLGFVSYFTD